MPAVRFFTCDNCHWKFERGRTEAEAMAEARAVYPADPLIDPAMLCDDCYEWLRSRFAGLTDAEREELEAESRAART